MSGPAPATFFPDTTGCPRAYQALRAACDPRDTTPDSPPLIDVHPLGMLLEYAITAKLTCLLADWLNACGHTAHLPRPMQQFLNAQQRLNMHRWRLHHREAARVIAALDAHSIPAAAINGIAHASLLYNGRGTRQSSDVDILIPAETADTAVQILTSLGYTPTGRRPTARRLDLDDPVVPGLTLDLTSRLAHTSDPPAIVGALASRVPAPSHSHAPEPLPILARDDGLLHTLARVASQRRWPALADGLRYALDGTGRPATADVAIPSPAAAGWELLRSCWPELPTRPPLTDVTLESQ